MPVASQSISFLFNAAGLADSILRPPSRVELDSLIVDATLLETHTAAADVTEHPVEVGSDITDHIRPKPVELSIDGFITNTPIDPSLISAAIRASPLGVGVAAAESIALAAMPKANFARDAFDQLRNIRDKGLTITIVTPLRTYDTMAMVSLQVVRDAQVGDALHFQAAFRQIRTVESATTTIQLPPDAQASLPMGTVSTEKASGGLMNLNADPLESWFGSTADKIGLVQPPRL